MKEDYSVLRPFWGYVEEQNTKISNNVEEWLSKDNLNDIIVSGGYYYTELVTSYSVMPNYVYDYIERYMNKQGILNQYTLTK